MIFKDEHGNEHDILSKDELVVGNLYYGDCRNASEAVWHGTHFTYTRYKFGTSFSEDIMHPEDDDGHDLFLPLRKENPIVNKEAE